MPFLVCSAAMSAFKIPPPSSYPAQSIITQLCAGPEGSCCNDISMKALGPLGGTKHFAPEEKLAIEIGDIDGVHVNDIDVAYAAKCQVLQQLTTKATCRCKASHITFPYTPTLA